MPGKVLADIGGRSMLARVVRRARRAGTIDETRVVTSLAKGDDAVAAEAGRLEVPCFRGSEEDVLDRYLRAAQESRADVVVRVTADCPLIAPEIIDRTVEVLIREQPRVDFASNVVKRTFPRGLDVEVCSYPALDRVWRLADNPADRAHVFPYIYRHPADFSIASIAEERVDRSGMRWTVDTADDLEFIRAVYSRFNNDDSVAWGSVVELLSKEPALAAINQAVRQKALEEG